MKGKGMKRISTLMAAAVFAICLGHPGSSSVAAIYTLNSPSDINNPSSITFDGYADLSVANNLYQNQGITFTRDDGKPVFISDWSALGRVTTTSPNVLATIADLQLTSTCKRVGS